MPVYTDDGIEIKHNKHGAQHIEAKDMIKSDKMRELFKDLKELREEEKTRISGDGANGEPSLG